MSLQRGQPAALDAHAKADFDAVVRNYDMHGHGPGDRAAVTNELSPDVIDRYALAGAPEVVTRRLLELMELGLKRLVLRPSALLVAEVLPALRASASNVSGPSNAGRASR
jgi:hypothetical protein